MKPDLSGDVVRPEDEDWALVTESALYDAVRAGVAEAIAEAKRRGFDV